MEEYKYTYCFSGYFQNDAYYHNMQKQYKHNGTHKKKNSYYEIVIFRLYDFTTIITSNINVFE